MKYLTFHPSSRPSFRAFTLIETMVAVATLTLAVSGAFFAANSAFLAASVSRDQLTASYLAQEGIEYARLLRDNAYLSAYQAGGATVSQNAWNAFLSGPIASCTAQTPCTYDPVSPTPLVPCSGACTPLYLVSGSRPYYTQQSGNGAMVTSFTRTIQATAVSLMDERIVSTVLWSSHGVRHSVTVSDHLTLWQ